jgi:hypothetical protein
MEVFILDVLKINWPFGKNSKVISPYNKPLRKLTYDFSGDLTTDERDDYVKSVLCLMSAP